MTTQILESSTKTLRHRDPYLDAFLIFQTGTTPGTPRLLGNVTSADSHRSEKSDSQSLCVRDQDIKRRWVLLNWGLGTVYMFSYFFLDMFISLQHSPTEHRRVGNSACPAGLLILGRSHVAEVGSPHHGKALDFGWP